MSRTAPALGGAVTMVLGLGLIGAPVASAAPVPAQASTLAVVSETAGPVARIPLSTPIARANIALARAVANLRTRHPRRAIVQLRVLQRQVLVAHVVGSSLIGAPAADPESDDTPGPPAVTAVLAMDHRVAMGVVSLFDRRRSRRPFVVRTLRITLTATQLRRDALLRKVVAVPGDDLDDYSDGIADTLGGYAAEVGQLSAALRVYRLTPAGRLGLRQGLSRARATTARVNAAFGGGE